MERALAIVGLLAVVFLIGLGAISAVDRFAVSLKALPLRTEVVNTDYQDK